MRTALVTVLATGAVSASVTSTVVAYTSASESVKAVASMDTTLSAIARHLPPLERTARAASPPPPIAASPVSPAAEPVPWRGIVRLNDGEFLVATGTANDILQGPAGFLRTARIVPEQQNGRVVGIRVYGATDSFLGRLGIENGDRIERINGVDMSSPENAMSVYDSFRWTNDVRVIVNRRGRTITLHYRVV
jgi:general secretion pathway protein C